ncbi:hypothetical protein X965_03680 [Morganella sp. EGD-HP17]|nr:hypothetical protein X965_03680 [Morganella sp. EGD-HP17]
MKIVFIIARIFSAFIYYCFAYNTTISFLFS